MTVRRTTQSRMTLSTTTLSRMTLGRMTLSRTTISRMAQVILYDNELTFVYQYILL